MSEIQNHPTTSELSGSLEEVRRRDSEFRLSALKDFLELGNKLRAAEQKLFELEAKASERDTYVHSLHLEREELLKLNVTLQERDAYIHKLHLEREKLLEVQALCSRLGSEAVGHATQVAALQAQLAEQQRLRDEHIAVAALVKNEHQNEIQHLQSLIAAKDERILEFDKTVYHSRHAAESLARELDATHDRLVDTTTRLRSIRSSIAWFLAKPLHSLERYFSPVQPKPKQTALEAFPLRYFIHTPLHELHKRDNLEIRGWVYAPNDQRILTVRARLEGQLVEASYDHEDKMALAEGSVVSRNGNAGFRVRVQLPKGRSHLFLEVHVENIGWRAMVDTPLFRTAP